MSKKDKGKKEQPTGPAAEKAIAFLADVKAANWEGSLEVSGELAVATASRGEESIVISWEGTRHRDCFYKFGSRELVLRNSSACRKRMALSVEEAGAEAEQAAGSGARRVRRGAAEQDEPSAPTRATVASRLPFSLASDTSETILGSLLGHRLVWTVELCGFRMEREGRVDRTAKRHLRIEEREGGARLLHFVDEEYGFTSLNLSDLVAVR